MDVKESLLAALASDAVDLFAGREQKRAGQGWGFGKRYAFGPQAPDLCNGTEVPEGGEGCEWECLGAGAEVVP
jgi:hypothetical protein